MQKSCTECRQTFKITKNDLEFYDKVSPVFNGKKELIPPPTLCPDCRMQRRMSFRNERNLYHRKSDKSGKPIISSYRDGAIAPIISREEWWSDLWNGIDAGKAYNDAIPFFEQMKQLWKGVPMICLWNADAENSDYNVNCFGLKNSYMNMNSDYGENMFYCLASEQSHNVMDCAFIWKSEYCYGCNDLRSCYHCIFSSDLQNSNHCYFSSDLVGCSRCFGCHGLRQADLCIFNEKVTEDIWKEKVEQLKITPDVIDLMNQHSKEVAVQFPHRALHQIHCESSIGDHLVECKNCTNAYDVTQGESVHHAIYVPYKSINTRDVYAIAGAENVYESLGGGMPVTSSAFLYYLVNGVHDSFYCIMCVNDTKNCFGCIGLKHQQYCILNKQYTKDEYEVLVPRIIEKMRKDGEWGEFFPSAMSPFAYNETVAQEYFPMTEEEVLARGWKWYKEEEKKEQYMGPAYKIPEEIQEVPDDILQQILLCKTSGRPYKIIPQELQFYRQMNLPIPRKCPDQRHKERMALRNPRQLWKRTCAKCSKNIQTTYAPGRPEVVYCEDCYLQTVY